MRVIVDTSADRRIDPEVAQDLVTTPAVKFAQMEHEVSCPNCDSRLAFRATDPQVVMAGFNATITCPVHGGTFVVDIRKAGTAAKAMSRLSITSTRGVAAGGVIGTLSGQRTGSVLSIGADSTAGFSIVGNVVSSAAMTPGLKTLNITETQAGVYGNPRTTSFAVTIA